MVMLSFGTQKSHSWFSIGQNSMISTLFFNQTQGASLALSGLG
ncbi:hypothetical protein IHE45_17G057600 [Dioscorea alata]|uniref:Uncharacterized protein n=1 Tax=Dioscorea alata TaxID=55571 RepID=A0ACB7UCQ6_DIOAL|nr:hypothetical protein IHE45_17G057600 [Dioscorea alata]